MRIAIAGLFEEVNTLAVETMGLAGVNFDEMCATHKLPHHGLRPRSARPGGQALSTHEMTAAGDDADDAEVIGITCSDFSLETQPTTENVHACRSGWPVRGV